MTDLGPDGSDPRAPGPSDQLNIQIEALTATLARPLVTDTDAVLTRINAEAARWPDRVSELLSMLLLKDERIRQLKADLAFLSADLDAVLLAKEQQQAESDALEALLSGQIAQRDRLLARVRGNNQALLRQLARQRQEIADKDEEIRLAGIRLTNLEVELQEKIGDLEDEKRFLTRHNAGLQRERDGLQASLTQLTAERDALVAERAGLVAARDAAVVERDRLQVELAEERDRAREQLEALECELTLAKRTVEEQLRQVREQFEAQGQELYAALVELALNRHELAVRDRQLLEALHQAGLKDAGMETMARHQAFLYSRIAWLERLVRVGNGKEESVSETNKGQRNLPLPAILIAALVAAVIGVFFDRWVGLTNLAAEVTTAGVEWVFSTVLAVLVIVGYYWSRRFKRLDKYIPIYGGEIDDIEELPLLRGTSANAALERLISGDAAAAPPLHSLQALRDAVTAAQGQVDAARQLVATRKGELDQAKRELDGAVTEMVARATALAAPLPGGGGGGAAAAARAQREADLQAAKVVLEREIGEHQTARQNHETAVRGSPAVPGGAAAVIGLEGREQELRDATQALQHRERDIAEAKANRKPACINVHGRQVRAFLAIILLGVLACDHFDVNHKYACVRVSRNQPANGWVSRGIESPRVVDRTSFIKGEDDRFRLGRDVERGTDVPVEIRLEGGRRHIYLGVQRSDGRPDSDLVIETGVAPVGSR